MNTKKETSELIKKKALEFGFSDCGICKAEYLKDNEPLLRDSLQNDYNGSKEYLRYNLEKRLNPQNIIENGKSVISLLINYYTTENLNQDSHYKVSRYAFGKDYHLVIKEKLTLLEDFIKTLFEEVKTILFVDAAAVLEKALAVKSGLGWIGKNCLLINKEFGSYCFISEIIIDKELEYDEPFTKDLCGDCNKCIEACPTNALVKPNVLDARKCIAYNTIEVKGDKPEFDVDLNNWIYGCDVCQDVCPWNKRAIPTSEINFRPNPALLSMTKDDWENLTEEKFNSLFQNTSVTRTKYQGLMRNIKLSSN